jgi:hypothetical protein
VSGVTGEPDWLHDWLRPTRLELLADDAGVTPGELRAWLYAEIRRRESRTSVAAETPAEESVSLTSSAERTPIAR